MTKASFEKRTIASEPLNGKIIDVEVPTYVTGLMQFDNGAIGTIFTTFDVYNAQVPCIEIYGSEGTISVPDPNTFEGPVLLYRAGSNEFKEIPLMFPYENNSRGLGLADMAKAIQAGRKPRANSEQILHVLEIMTSFQTSSEQGKHITIESKYQREKPMVYDLLKGVLD